MWTDPGTIQIALRHMNVEIGAEAALFPEKEYIYGIFVAVPISIRRGGTVYPISLTPVNEF
jgi:hypothetical protein